MSDERVQSGCCSAAHHSSPLAAVETVGSVEHGSGASVDLRRTVVVAARWVVGLLLVLSALAKLLSPSDGVSLARMLWGLHGDLLWSAVEVVVGTWLMAGWQAGIALRAALALFGAFIGVNGVLAWSGSASCGCLGAVRTGPLSMLAMDALLAVWLLVGCRWTGALRHPDSV
ncbi:MAG: hypothetical protein KatS3mg109_1225 [Pirellulaceae bacterium]|nr:MAG: hypothetical protein KatS3mg109_1225 [Pirellulaceae bacterium]GIW94854.1 MAG: hypothetical protein KatS3mg110_2895 [Pirellulaceae bacterium]